MPYKYRSLNGKINFKGFFHCHAWLPEGRQLLNHLKRTKSLRGCPSWPITTAGGVHKKGLLRRHDRAMESSHCWFQIFRPVTSWPVGSSPLNMSHLGWSYMDWLAVDGWPTPSESESQLGWWHPIYYGKIKFMFQTTNQKMKDQNVTQQKWPVGLGASQTMGLVCLGLCAMDSGLTIHRYIVHDKSPKDPFEWKPIKQSHQEAISEGQHFLGQTLDTTPSQPFFNVFEG